MTTVFLYPRLQERYHEAQAVEWQSSEHHTLIRTEPLRGCNNLHCVTNGDLYFTDLSQSDLQRPDGRVFRLTPDDQLEYLIDCGVSPNLVGIGGECGRQYKQSIIACREPDGASRR